MVLSILHVSSKFVSFKIMFFSKWIPAEVGFLYNTRFCRSKFPPKLLSFKRCCSVEVNSRQKWFPSKQAFLSKWILSKLVSFKTGVSVEVDSVEVAFLSKLPFFRTGFPSHLRFCRMNSRRSWFLQNKRFCRSGFPSKLVSFKTSVSVQVDAYRRWFLANMWFC